MKGDKPRVARSRQAANGNDLVSGHSTQEGFDDCWSYATPPYVRSKAVSVL